MSLVTKQSKVSIDTTSTSLVDEATDRVMLIVNAPNANKFTMSLEDTAVLYEGITMYLSNPPLIFTKEEHGPLVTLAWTAISDTSSQDVTVIEMFDRP